MTNHERAAARLALHLESLKRANTWLIEVAAGRRRGEYDAKQWDLAVGDVRECVDTIEAELAELRRSLEA